MSKYVNLAHVAGGLPVRQANTRHEVIKKMCVPHDPDWKAKRLMLDLDTAAGRAAWRAMEIPFRVTANPAAYYG
jgi:hypothetical protein